MIGPAGATPLAVPWSWPCWTLSAVAFVSRLRNVTEIAGRRICSSRETGFATAGPSRPRRARKLRFTAWKLWIYGFRQVKVKVGIEGQDDVDRVGAIRRRMGRKVDLRIDANEAWTPANVAASGSQP